MEKLIVQLAYPLALSIVLILSGLLMVWLRRPQAGTAVALVGVVWLAVWSLPPVSDGVRASLEQGFNNLPADSTPRADAIVLLGGGERGAPADWPYPDLGRDADRIWHAARLFHAGKAEYIIVSGGRMDWTGDREAGAEAMKALLVDLNVPESAILMEAESRNTRENAVNSAAIASASGIDRVLLVTSALHMRRALATFRALRLEVEPAPADFEVMPEPAHLLRWLPSADALRDSSRAIKEYLAYWVYRARGWIE